MNEEQGQIYNWPIRVLKAMVVEKNYKTSQLVNLHKFSGSRDQQGHQSFKHASTLIVDWLVVLHTEFVPLANQSGDCTLQSH